MGSSMIFAGIAGVLVVVLLFLTIRGGKAKTYKVVSSQPDPETGGVITEELSRGYKEKWNDIKDMKCFKNAEGRKVYLGIHWIIRIEEI